MGAAVRLGDSSSAEIHMKMRQLVCAMCVVVCAAAVARAQFFVPAPAFGVPLPLAAAPVADSRRALQHRAVVLNAEAEARLPPALQNPFYKNPRIEAALAKESWFTPEEMQVREREAEKIPRAKIFSILKNAGLARRR
ncbi:uncharacterized protein LOC126248106 isoform X1 [Schistocerca nitens]|uniref:uncharacterized protein LOC126248106 isoform X1 n=2 Tax=Schistocerca nitens TaxID=7011 RepID=UPI002117698A|nr:uncharacterized protein LOC126248106 isoform X1 [Schistocerca nitens]